MKKAIFALFGMLTALVAVAADGGKIVVSSYPWQRLSIVEMLKDVKAMGVDKVSMFQNMKIGGNGKNADVRFHYSMSPEARAEAKKIFADANVKVVSIGHITLTDEAQIRKQFEFAKDFGVEVMTVESMRQALPIYERMAGEFGIKCGLYNHPASKRTKYPTPEAMLDAVKNFKNLKCFPDCGHWGRSHFDIVECARKLKGSMVAVNVQDLASDDNCEQYGKGRQPLAAFVDELKSQNFDGYYIVMFNVAPDRSQIEKVAPSVKFMEAQGLKK